MQASEQIFYQRNTSYIPRIAAVHDMCGYGKCSLTVAIPVLSAAGCDVCPVPTSLFSSHTLFPTFAMHDTTSFLEEYLDAWQAVDIDIDAIYSGFLGAPEQVNSIKRLYQTYPQALRFVDPVMADHGKVYPTYTPELCDAMSSLAQDAHILTPNLTEASIITGIDYEGQSPSESYIDHMIEKLLETGAQSVVLKGIEREDGKIYNYIGGQNLDRAICCNKKLPYQLHGTGDLYASSLLAAVMAGKDLLTAVEFAGTMVYESMLATKDQPQFEMRGVQFELTMAKLTSLL